MVIHSGPAASRPHRPGNKRSEEQKWVLWKTVTLLELLLVDALRLLLLLPVEGGASVRLALPLAVLQALRLLLHHTLLECLEFFLQETKGERK